MLKLHVVEYSALDDLIKEAKDSNAFLPSKDDEGIIFLEEMERIESCHFLLYKDELYQAGFAVLLPYSEPDMMSIGPTYIKKEFQGHGIGKSLVKDLITYSNEAGLKGLYTKTWGKNKPSRRIFESLGFECVGEKPKARINGDSTVKYFLELK